MKLYRTNHILYRIDKTKRCSTFANTWYVSVKIVFNRYSVSYQWYLRWWCFIQYVSFFLVSSSLNIDSWKMNVIQNHSHRCIHAIAHFIALSTQLYNVVWIENRFQVADSKLFILPVAGNVKYAIERRYLYRDDIHNSNNWHIQCKR